MCVFTKGNYGFYGNVVLVYFAAIIMSLSDDFW